MYLIQWDFESKKNGMMTRYWRNWCDKYGTSREQARRYPTYEAATRESQNIINFFTERGIEVGGGPRRA